MAKIKFDVLINCSFAEICNNPDLSPIENNSLLSNAIYLTSRNHYDKIRKTIHNWQWV